ncbi:MAG: transporter substrate-binding domain-containing protein [Pseudomonadales bacterium]|nr:transporter substrate-binding domain-containing protein [Halioglobus sp.]MCP5121367.1 transporter substrate-binding domain-containing protein [Pseudomonadales bacterium]MCP5193293.1 transporter substrate-binding domain-containing protein [Pseudomonadales bacterium]
MSNFIQRLMLGGLLVLAATLSVNASAGDTLQRVIDFKVLKVGMSGNQPPMSMTNREGGLMGFDVDLAKALADAMKVKLEIVPMPFGKLLSALEDNKVDMVMSGLAITPERTEMVSFVGPYMMSGKSILTKNSTLAKIEASKDFNRKELKLLALSNSTSASFVKTVAPDAQLIEIASYDEGVAMVIDGKADALVADMPVCVLSVLRYPEAGLTTLERPLTVEPVGIAVSKDDPQFFNLVDNYLRAYEKTGILGKIRAKWFEDSSWVVALP